MREKESAFFDWRTGGPIKKYFLGSEIENHRAKQRLETPICGPKARRTKKTPRLPVVSLARARCTTNLGNVCGARRFLGGDLAEILD